MKSFTFIFLSLFAFICFAREEADPALIPRTFGVEPNVGEKLVAANVEYEFSKDAEVK